MHFKFLTVCMRSLTQLSITFQCSKLLRKHGCFPPRTWGRCGDRRSCLKSSWYRSGSSQHFQAVERGVGRPIRSTHTPEKENKTPDKRNSTKAGKLVAAHSRYRIKKYRSNMNGHETSFPCYLMGKLFF